MVSKFSFLNDHEKRLTYWNFSNQRCLPFIKKIWVLTDLNDTESSWFENVITLFDSSLGTGKRYFKMFVQRVPNFVVKL